MFQTSKHIQINLIYPKKIFLINHKNNHLLKCKLLFMLSKYIVITQFKKNPIKNITSKHN